MNNTIVPFNNAALGCSVRTVIINEEPWFVAKDVCNALSIADSKSSLRFLEDEEKGVHSMHTLGGTQQVSIINESGLYSLILRSRKPEAKKFKKWVTAEVLPSIRKHGAYATKAKLEEMLSDPDAMILTLQALKAEREKRKALEAKIEEDAPYTEFGKSVEVSAGCMLIGEFAKVLAQNGREIGQNRLFELLRNEGILGKTGNRRNVPSQEHVEAGRFRVSYRIIQHASGRAESKATPYLTPKGQVWLLKRMTGNKTEQKEVKK